MTDGEIKSLAGTYLRYVLDAAPDERLTLLAAFGREVERWTRQRALAVAAETVNRIDDRNYRPR